MGDGVPFSINLSLAFGCFKNMSCANMTVGFSSVFHVLVRALVYGAWCIAYVAWTSMNIFSVGRSLRLVSVWLLSVPHPQPY